MSRPRYAWWSYVKAIVRKYPQMLEEYRELHTQATTANYTGMPRSGGAERGTENIAVRELPTTRQREYEAVMRALKARIKKIKEVG